MSRPPVVHLRGDAGHPACGFHRWGSETVTTNGDPAAVTCRRGGCAQARPQASLPGSTAGVAIDIKRLVVETYEVRGAPGAWESKVTLEIKDHGGSRVTARVVTRWDHWPEKAEVAKEAGRVVAEQVTAMLTKRTA